MAASDRWEVGETVLVRARIAASQPDDEFVRIEFSKGPYQAAPVACVLPGEIVEPEKG